MWNAIFNEYIYLFVASYQLRDNIAQETRSVKWSLMKTKVTLKMSAKWFDMSLAFHGGLVVVISIIAQPTLQTSQPRP